jgi:hypothetical protein
MVDRMTAALRPSPPRRRATMKKRRQVTRR